MKNRKRVEPCTPPITSSSKMPAREKLSLTCVEMSGPPAKSETVASGAPVTESFTTRVPPPEFASKNTAYSAPAWPTNEYVTRSDPDRDPLMVSPATTRGLGGAGGGGGGGTAGGGLRRGGPVLSPHESTTVTAQRTAQSRA